MEQPIKEAAARLRTWIESTAEHGEAPVLTREAEQDLLALVGWVEGIAAVDRASGELSRVMRDVMTERGLSVEGAESWLSEQFRALTAPDGLVE